MDLDISKETNNKKRKIMVGDGGNQVNEEGLAIQPCDNQ